MYISTFTSCGTTALQNVIAEYNDSIQCQSEESLVNNINNVDKDLDTVVHVEAVDTPLPLQSDRDATGPMINNSISIYKRRLEDVTSPPQSPKRIKKSKKGASNSSKTTSPSGEGVDEKRRVGCPFFKKDGTLKQPSCNGKGWPDPGKMKDHLKSVHRIDPKWLFENIHFKEKPYFGEPIDVQWKLAFQKIFPKVPKDEIPSPYIDDISPPPRSAIPTKDTDDLGNIIQQKLLDEFRIEQFCGLPVTISNIRATFMKVYSEALQDWREHVPVSSAESFDYVLPETLPPKEDHDLSTPERNLSSLAVQILTSIDLPMSPQVKIEPTELSPRMDRYRTPEDNYDAKPVIDAGPAEGTLIHSLEQVAKAEIPSSISSLDQGYTFTTIQPFTSPIVLPFGQEYPFLATSSPNCSPQSEHLNFAHPNLEPHTVVETPFIGAESSLHERNTFMSGYNMSFMATPCNTYKDPNEEGKTDGELDLVANASMAITGTRVLRKRIRKLTG